ncbi:Prokineticin receptor 1 [Liparis tanakae]|uniref:Prokineticin receptor 1 n=1 Tax=Liparis tanakae TaxID=230148 RepID=A0A4Z2EJP7_9TELE|nr:Prokineticin receptor 1 [Liparis tanakae]
MAILHPLRPRMKTQTACCVLLTVWMVPVFVSVPSAYMASEMTYPHAAGGRAHKTFCAQIWPVDQRAFYRTYFLLVFALEFVGPVSVMAACYARISRELWFKDPPGFKTDQIRKRLRRRRRTVVVLILVLAAYVLCWAPYYGFALLRDFYPTLISGDRNSLVVFYVIECVAMSNGVINTLCFMSVRRNNNNNNGGNNKRPKEAGKFRLKMATFAAAKSPEGGEARTCSLRVTEEAEGARLK